MAMQRIEHVSLAMPAGEEDTARRFYAQAMGMTEVPKPEELAQPGGSWFEDGDVRVHLGVQNDCSTRHEGTSGLCGGRSANSYDPAG
jgi:hypothetical protein